MKKLFFLFCSLFLHQEINIQAFSVRYCDPINPAGTALNVHYLSTGGGTQTKTLTTNQSFNDSSWTNCPNGDCGMFNLSLSSHVFYGPQSILVPSHGSIYVVPCKQPTMGFYIWSADCDVNGSGADCGSSYCFQNLKTTLNNSLCQGQGDAYGQGATTPK